MIIEPIHEQLEQITAMSFSESAQCLAIACKLFKDSSAYILFFDPSQPNLIRKIGKVVHEGSPADSEEKTFTSIGFSQDTKYIITLTNHSDGKVKIYEWRRDVRVIASTTWLSEIKKESKEFEGVDINKVTLDPNNKDQMCFSGINHARIWRVQGAALKLAPAILKLDQKRNYTEHAWLENNWLVFGDSQGELSFAYDNKECVKIIKAFGDIPDSISCIMSYRSGFLVGGDQGQVSNWEFDKKSEKEGNVLAEYQFNRSLSKI